jgi:hypothetical protein
MADVGTAGQEVRRAGVPQDMDRRAGRNPRRTAVLPHEQIERGRVKPPPLRGRGRALSPAGPGPARSGQADLRAGGIHAAGEGRRALVRCEREPDRGQTEGVAARPRRPPGLRTYRSTAYTRIGVPPLNGSALTSSFSTPRGQTWAHMPQPTHEARFTSVLAMA